MPSEGARFRMTQKLRRRKANRGNEMPNSNSSIYQQVGTLLRQIKLVPQDTLDDAEQNIIARIEQIHSGQQVGRIIPTDVNRLQTIARKLRR